MWPSDAIWRHGYGSALAQVMACCLTAPSHHLNQCWLSMREVLWHSEESDFAVSAEATFLYKEFENHTFRITATSLNSQWTKSWEHVHEHWCQWICQINVSELFVCLFEKYVCILLINILYHHSTFKWYWNAISRKTRTCLTYFVSDALAPVFKQSLRKFALRNKLSAWSLKYINYILISWY